MDVIYPSSSSLTVTFLAKSRAKVPQRPPYHVQGVCQHINPLHTATNSDPKCSGHTNTTNHPNRDPRRQLPSLWNVHLARSHTECTERPYTARDQASRSGECLPAPGIHLCIACAIYLCTLVILVQCSAACQRCPTSHAYG